MTIMIINTTFEEAKNIMENTALITVADVREECEYVTGHVEKAVNLALSLLIDVSKSEGRAFAENVVPDKAIPVMVYCRTGKRSSLAANALDEFGYQIIYDMGGLSGWPYGLSYD